MDDDKKRREALQVMIDRDVTMKYDPEQVQSISAKEAADVLGQNTKKVLFVDVRSKKEFLTSAIPNAVHYEEFEAMVKRPADQDSSPVENAEVICCYCTIGVRSARYVRWLKGKNFKQLSGKNLLNLKGSILDWTHEPSCAPLVKPSNDKVALGPLASDIHCFGDRWDLAATKYKSETFSLLEQAAEGARWSLY